jgi:peptidoglycan glycosyltransferase
MILAKTRCSKRFTSFAAMLTLALPALGQSAKPTYPELKASVASALHGRQGAVVVLDVDVGGLLASSNLDLAARKRVTPGSTVKPFVVRELLRLGKLDPAKRLVCPRKLTIAGRRLDCSHPAVPVSFDAADAIAFSCNFYVTQVALRLSGEELAAMYRRDGFLGPSGYARNEVEGSVQTAKTPEQVQLQAIGEQGIELTPLELAAVYRKLALHRGLLANMELPVFSGLERAVQFGMAHAAFVSEMQVAGKTGTAASPGTAHTHGLFVGYAPADRPAIVVLVYVEDGRGMDAAALAQPVFAAFQREAHK